MFHCLPVVFHSTPTPPSCLLPVALVPNYFSIAFHLFPSCIPDVVFQLSPLALNLKWSLLLVCTAGFIVSDSLDVFLYLPPSPLCLPLWLVVSDSLDFSFYCICFPGFPSCVSHSGVSGSLDACLHWFLFACLPVWLSTLGGVRLSRYLSSLVSFHLFPALASGVRMSSLCSHLLHIMFLLPSYSGFIYLSYNSSVFNHQSVAAVVSDSFACLPLCVSSIICF